MNTLFLIGPGKRYQEHSSGRFLAQALGFIGLSILIVGLRADFKYHANIFSSGYESYVRENAALCARLLAENPDEKRVVVLSSGFLATDVCPGCCNRQLVRQAGYSILLLPSEDIDIARIVV